jgi:flagellar motor switch protein FliN/FliY
MISPEPEPVGSTAMGYQLRAGERVVMLAVADLVEAAAPEPSRAAPVFSPPPPPASGPASPPAAVAPPSAGAATMRGAELLLDVELEASLRFGSREMALSELLALGPGDVVQLDRALNDPVDLIIGDKIVARGEVVLVNGNFGLQVTEVAEPRKSLESIRCLF